MPPAERDDNRVTTLLGRKPDGTVAPVQVDNATGRLLVSITDVTDNAPTVQPTEVRDDNRVTAAYGVDPNGDVASVLVDNRNGLVWADVNIE